MRENNFDFLRLLFASLVIITHSYALTGLRETDFLCQITNNQLSFSSIGVTGFFVISGFLITGSMLRCVSIYSFFKNRVLRLFPALVINILIVTFVLGYIVTNKSSHDYFSSISTRSYFIHNIILHTQYEIDGVFQSNPFPRAINGSLWTIPYEFLCYVVVGLIFFFRDKKILISVMIILLFIILLILRLFFSQYLDFNIRHLDLIAKSVVNLMLYFFAGSILFLFKHHFYEYKNRYLLGSLFILIITLVFNIHAYLQYITIPIFVLSVGLCATPILKHAGKWGDFSYGIYIYGFVVQQTILNYFVINYASLIIISIPISIVLGALSWHLVEKHALSLKDKYFSFSIGQYQFKI